ncbi:efflux RND transporter permease subunit [Methylomusa anaerophila]|nr:efflux RND transporter permease subunit [Methylomusa anaerophila]
MNLSEWALNHKQLMYFFIAVTIIAGFFSYQNLGRMEDPDFIIKQMIVSVSWPGATARQVEEQVTDKIEKKLQDTPGLDYIKSYSRPGQSLIYVTLKESIPAKDVRPTWLEVRNMVNDIKGTLPDGVAGPFFNDRFDDVFGCIYALTGDGYSFEEMREKGEKIRRILLGVPNVRKVDLIGVQTEKIYIEMENSKLSQLGIDPGLITSTIQAQNAMAAAGMLETATDNVYLRVSGMFEDPDAIRNLPIRSNDRTFRLGDIAKVIRSYAQPEDPAFYYNGHPAIGLQLSMEKGGNILTLGKHLDSAIQQIQTELPFGLEIHQVANQPKVVESSINEFIESLAEAIIIVLIVSFISLGVRSGLVVALAIPLVIAAVFVGMEILGVDLQKISLGALIIALGLLVDDAMIAIEMMVVKLELGWDRFRAASYAYTVTAFPMLTGTLITCAGFIPVGFSKGNASEMTGSIFAVVTLALLISWIVAATVTPLFGYALVKVKPAGNEHDHNINIYDTKFYRKFKRLLVWCLQHRTIVLGVTAVCFVASIPLLGLVKKEFFPPSTRPELIVDLTLPEGSSLKATEAVAKDFAGRLKDDPTIVNYSYYVGKGAPRFVLPFDPAFNKSNFAEFVIVAKDIDTRIALAGKIDQLLKTDFDNVLGNIKILQTGPPSAYPVMLRVSGYDHEKVREIAETVRSTMVANPDLLNINLDWNEKNKVMHLTIDQDKARLLGLNTQTLANSLQAQLSGTPIAQFREKDKTVDMVFRISPADRNNLANIQNMNIHIGNGKFVPLDQIAKISYDAEEGLIWRRNLKPTITVQANAAPGITGNDATTQTYAALQDLRASLPPGYSIDIGGPTENSANSSKALLGLVPVMILIIITLLMLQLQSIPKMILTLLTAPLGLIGVSTGLLLTGKAMGFVVQLGILALSGIIIRNSVILIDQIDLQLKAGDSTWNAIINATIHRFRPIMLTAAAAVLAMIPLVFSVFWGPMAVAIAAGLIVATLLTLLVFPTMYAAWYKAQPDQPANSPVEAPVTMD